MSESERKSAFASAYLIVSSSKRPNHDLLTLVSKLPTFIHTIFFVFCAMRKKFGFISQLGITLEGAPLNLESILPMEKKESPMRANWRNNLENEKKQIHLVVSSQFPTLAFLPVFRSARKPSLSPVWSLRRSIVWRGLLKQKS